MKKTIFFIFGFLLVAGTIFYFSSQPYSKQSLIPLFNEVLPQELIAKYFSFVSFTYGNTLISIETLGVSSFVEFFVRKAAHFCIFACFSIFAYLVMQRLIKKKKLCITIALFLTSTYAALDEVHQSFTGERTPMVQDVLLDITGAIVGLSLFLLITYWFSPKKKNT